MLLVVKDTNHNVGHHVTGRQGYQPQCRSSCYWSSRIPTTMYVIMLLVVKDTNHNVGHHVTRRQGY